MNREIKFRGKCSPQSKYQGEWVTGSLVVPEIIKDNELLIVVAHSDNCKTTYHVDKDTVGQFTGLQDKNGKDIYEGDILMCIGDRSDNKGKKYYRSVLFNHGSFCMTVPEYNCLSSLYSHVVNGRLLWEVVGNIYDNKDLLED